jgi:archaellum component FlaC
MTISKTLELILKRLDAIDARLDGLADDVDGIKDDISGIRTSVDALDLDDVTGSIEWATEEIARAQQSRDLQEIRADLRRVS